VEAMQPKSKVNFFSTEKTTSKISYNPTFRRLNFRDKASILVKSKCYLEHTQRQGGNGEVASVPLEDTFGRIKINRGIPSILKTKALELHN